MCKIKGEKDKYRGGHASIDGPALRMMVAVTNVRFWPF